MPEPIPLHPAADLALVLDEMRQSVAARGDEGWLTRALTAGICRALLGILDTLIDLLERFRAGTLPHVRSAAERTTIPARCEAAEPRIGSSPPARIDSAAADPQDVVSHDRHTLRGARTNDPYTEAAAAHGRSGVRRSALMPRRPEIVVRSQWTIRRPETASCGIADVPSAVPRSVLVESGAGAAKSTHVHNVAISY